MKRFFNALVLLYSSLHLAHADLVAVWRFDESSGSIATDSIGGYNGTWVPGVDFQPDWRPTTGLLGGAIDFPGSGNHQNYFSVPNFTPLIGKSGITISVWLSPDGQSGYRGVLMTRAVADSDGGPATQNYGIGHEDSHIDGRVSGAPTDTPSGTVPATSGWIHTALVWNSAEGTYQAYINGQPSGGEQAITKGLQILSSGEWRIGDDACCNNRNFNGKMDDLAVWDEPLSSAEVLLLYENGLNGIAAGEDTPLPVTQPLNVGLVINEVHYDADPKTVFTEFIELLNTNDQPMDIGGMRFTDGVDFQFPQGTMIPAAGYVIVAEDAAAFQANSPRLPDGTAVFEYQGSLSSDGERLELSTNAGVVVDRVDYNDEFPWPISSDGTGDSMQLRNATVDNDLGGSWQGAFPTPGFQNTTFVENAPPAIRQVSHTPQQPTSSDTTVISAKVTDPNGVEGVTLSYQLVAPGNFIQAFFALPRGVVQNDPNRPRTPNPAFEDPANWITVEMRDDGIAPDQFAGDGTYSVTLPAQSHRTLVRYRITAGDNSGASIRAPFADDPSLNFAYFSYDGVPDYVADLDSSHPDGVGRTYPSSMLTQLPVYHLITDAADLQQCWAYDSADRVGSIEARKAYNWEGALVYDGVVYDHINYRLRQKNDRYAGVGRRSMKFRFQRGHFFQARDPQGRRYDEKWRTMNTSKMSRFAEASNYGMRELLSSRLWRLAGVTAPAFHHIHLRVIDGVDEAPDQYTGDFYGLYTTFEDVDAQFMKQYDLPRGNVYKLKDGASNPLELLKFQAREGVTDASDFINIRDNLGPPRQSDQWLRDHVDWDRYYLYAAMSEGFRHWDYSPAFQKNRIWYFAPSPDNPLGKMSIIPHDTDATWRYGTNDAQINDPRYSGGTLPDGTTFRGRVVGIDLPKEAIQEITGLDGTDGENHPEREAFMLEYRNVIREVYDLLWTEEAVFSEIHRAYNAISEFAFADRDRWDNGPPEVGNDNMSSLDALLVEYKDLAFGADLYNGVVLQGGRRERLRQLAIDANIPATPTISSAGSATFQPGAISLQSSDFSDPQGDGTVAAVQWRVAEVPDSSSVPVPQLYLDTGATWKYYDFGNDPGSTWNQPGYDDSAWPSGPSELGYGDGDEAQVVNFVDVSSATGVQKNSTTFFRTTLDLVDATTSPGYELQIKADDGVVVYINGSEVYRDRVNTGGNDWQKYASSTTTNESGYVSAFVPDGILVTGTNVIAASVHQSNSSSSDISFDLRVRDREELFVHDVYEWNATWDSGERLGFTATTTVPAAATRTGRNYRARVRHKDNTGRWSHWSEPLAFVAGEPVAAGFQDALVVSEIMYHPRDLTVAEINAGFVDSDQFEYIEVRNVSNAPVDLSDIRFTKGVDFDFVTGAITQLAPGASVLVVREIAAFEFRHGTGLPVAGEFTGKLSNSTDLIKLSFGAGEALREFTYFDDPPWPTAVDGDGYSLSLIAPRTRPNHASPFSWRRSTGIDGMPGAADGTTLATSGIDTLENYAFAPEPSTAVMAGQQIQMKFAIRIDADDLSYQLVASTDLVTWDVPTDFLTQTALVDRGDGYAEVTFSGTSPMDHPTLFIRYEATALD